LTVLQALRQGHDVLAGLRGGLVRAEKILPTLSTQDQELLSRSFSQSRLHWIELDVDRIDHRANVVGWIDRHWSGQLDALVNNAGYGLLGPSEAQELGDIRAQFETNFFSVLALTQDLLPALRRARGVLIQVSSVVGLYSLPFYGPYSATKHALEAITEAWWHELSPWGVRVHLIEPGGFRTEFAAQVRWSGAGASSDLYKEFLNRFQSLHSKKAKKFGGDPNRVAAQIVKLIERPQRRLRFLLGSDAVSLHMLSRLLPDSVRLALVRRVFSSIFRGVGLD
jgi:NAD(P)-dependent dehydrogenase (short-subunit alcohol dehydrogenase family)